MALIYAGDPAWTDYVFQTQVITETENTIMVLKSSEPGITEYRVEFWWQGSYAYPNKYNAYKYLNGNFEELPGGFGTSPIPITQTSLLKVQIIGSHLTLFVDDQFVADIVDLNPLPSGKIGLGVWNVTATFDDVLVSTPPACGSLPD